MNYEEIAREFEKTPKSLMSAKPKELLFAEDYPEGRMKIVCAAMDQDLEMLRSVGYGFAMGNAPEHVRRQCRRATDSFERDGIGKAIRRYILEEGE